MANYEERLLERQYQRIGIYAFFSGQVKGLRQMFEKNWLSRDEFIEKLTAVDEELERKLTDLEVNL